MAAAAIVIAFAFLAQPCVANRGHEALGILAQEDDSLPPPQEQPAGGLSPARGVDQDVEAENESPPPALLEDALNSTEDPCNDPAKISDKLRDACSKSWTKRKEVASGEPMVIAMEKEPNKTWPLLIKLADDDYEWVRAAAAGEPFKIVIEKDPNKSWPLLAKLADDYHPDVRAAAAGSLATAIKQEPDKVFPLLVNLTEDNYYKVRRFAGGKPMVIAMEKEPNKTWPLLIKLADDGAEAVRVAAAGPPLVEAFKKMPEKSAPILATLLGDPSERVRRVAAGDALLEAVQHVPLASAQALVEQAANHTDKEVVNLAVRPTAWVAKAAEAKAKEQAELLRKAQAETEFALGEAKTAKAESDANLQWNHWLQRIMAILVVVFIGLLILAWNGQRMLTEYQERNRQERIKAQVNARTTATATSHKFFFVDANMIRGWQGGPIPHFQSLMPLGWLIEKTWDLGEAIRGMYNEDYLIISHRWYSPQHPDPTGEKVKELQEFLKKNPSIRYVWMDFWSLPQSKEGRRTEEEEVTFRLGLANIFMLFISAQVLVLFDMQYAGRFWTSYELWLSLRTITAQGLESTPAHSRRATMVCMGASNQAAEKNKDSMHETWAEKSPEEAAAVLGAEDIVVTNKKDKDQQLNVLRELAANAAAIFMRCVG